MDDILLTMAWRCDDKDCPSAWHKANYWTYDDGSYSVDSYSDGDHEGVAEADLPTDEEVTKSWKEYAKYVAETGTDPLESFYVKYTTKVTEKWLLRFNKSILGPVLLAARHAGRDYTWRDVPKHISDYLGLSGKNAKLGDFARWDEFQEYVPGLKPMRWGTFMIERDKPRKPATVARELKRLARRAA